MNPVFRFAGGLGHRVRGRVRHHRRTWLWLPALALLGGCAGFPADAPHVWYELRDPGAPAVAPAVPASPARTPAPAADVAARAPAAIPAAGRTGKPGDCTVLVTASAVNAFYATTALVWSRQPGQLGLYQYASWSEEPAAKIGRLFSDRLRTAGFFADVAPATGLVRGRWLIELELDTLLHDDRVPPGVGRLGLSLRVIDRDRSRTVAFRRFDTEEPLARESAAAAAAALGAALARALDQAESWLPQQVVPACGTAAIDPQ